MIVPGKVIPAIEAGTVTQLRLPIGRWTPKSRDGVRGARLHRDEAGTITRRAAGKEVIARLKITRYRRALLDDTTDDDARTEGYQGVPDLMRWWFDVYDAVWTGAECWVVSFTVDRAEPVRLLANVAGYTSSSSQAMPEEPEAVDPAHIKAFSEKAQARWQRDQAQREAIYRALPLDQKLRIALEDERLRVAGRNDLRVIEKRLEAIWRRGKAA
jgi:hypothetical protein